MAMEADLSRLPALLLIFKAGPRAMRSDPAVGLDQERKKKSQVRCKVLGKYTWWAIGAIPCRIRFRVPNYSG